MQKGHSVLCQKINSTVLVRGLAFTVFVKQLERSRSPPGEKLLIDFTDCIDADVLQTRCNAVPVALLFLFVAGLNGLVVFPLYCISVLYF